MIHLATTPDDVEPASPDNIIAKLDNAKDLTRFVELALINRDRYGSKSDCLASITIGAFQFAARKLTRDKFALEMAKKSVISSLLKLRHGHFVIDFQNLLSIDRLSTNYVPTVRDLIWTNRHHLAREAEMLLQQQSTAPARLKRHWVYLASLPLLNNVSEYEIHSQNILNNAENL